MKAGGYTWVSWGRRGGWQRLYYPPLLLCPIAFSLNGTWVPWPLRRLPEAVVASRSFFVVGCPLKCRLEVTTWSRGRLWRLAYDLSLLPLLLCHIAFSLNGTWGLYLSSSTSAKAARGCSSLPLLLRPVGCPLKCRLGVATWSSRGRRGGWQR